MKHGTILRNLWQPSYESYLVYMGTSGRNALCLWLINGRFATSALTLETFPKNDILTDREHFPVVGYVPIEKIIHDAIIERIGEQEHEILTHDEPPVFDSEEEADAYYSEMAGFAEVVEMESGEHE